MVSTIDEARTPTELAEWLRVWADGYEEGIDYLDDNDARQLAEAVERVCQIGNAAASASASPTATTSPSSSAAASNGGSAMIEASPRPWRCECGPTVNAVIAANGAVVVPHTGYAANAALIVAAVNEYEELAAENSRLRKEVGRFRSAAKLLEAAAGPYCAPELRPVLIAEAREELAAKESEAADA